MSRKASRIRPPTATIIDRRAHCDVDFARVALKASHVTPVVDGVRTMTVTMLLANTIKAAERAPPKLKIQVANGSTA